MSMAFRVFFVPEISRTPVIQKLNHPGFTIFRGYVGAITQLVKLIDGPSSKPTMVTLSPRKQKKKNNSNKQLMVLFLHMYIYIYTYI